jgi:hypothetical protein
MKISIDTKEDSHDDIRKVIKMLQHLVGEDSYSNYKPSRNIFEDSSPSLPVAEQSSSPTNAFSSMFGSDETIQNTPVVKETVSEEIKPKAKKFDFSNEVIVY